MDTNDTTNVPYQLAALTSGVPQVLVQVTMPQEGSAGGVVYCNIYCSDGTDHQVIDGLISYSFLSKGGTVTGTTTKIGLENKNVTSGTINTVWTADSSGNVNLTCTTSLTPTNFWAQCRYEKSAQCNEVL